MIKPAFGVKNILVVIINIPLVFICTMYTLAACHELLTGNISGALMGVPGAAFVYYFGFNIQSNIFPKYFKCMQAVTRYIEYKDLKDLLKDEEFVPFEFPQDIVQILREYHIRDKHYKIQFSQNWIYADGVYITKKMFWGTWASEVGYNRVHKIMFELIENERIIFGYFHRCCGIPEACFDKGIEIPSIKNRKRCSKKKFKNIVKTKEEFLKFLNKS